MCVPLTFSLPLHSVMPLSSSIPSFLTSEMQHQNISSITSVVPAKLHSAMCI